MQNDAVIAEFEYVNQQRRMSREWRQAVRAMNTITCRGHNTTSTESKISLVSTESKTDLNESDISTVLSKLHHYGKSPTCGGYTIILVRQVSAGNSKL